MPAHLSGCLRERFRVGRFSAAAHNSTVVSWREEIFIRADKFLHEFDVLRSRSLIVNSAFRRSQISTEALLKMAAQLLDGAAVAEEIKQKVAARVKELEPRGVRPGLAAVTDTGADVVWFPAVSRATAVSVCAPLLAAVEFHSPR